MELFTAVNNLYKQECFDSACSLGFVLVASSPTLDSTLLLAQSLYGNEEYKRALVYFGKALVLGRSKKVLQPRSRTPTKDSARTPTKDAGFTEEKEIDIKMWMAKCHLKLKDDTEASSLLEGISSNKRPLKANLLLADIARRRSADSSIAKKYYREALRQCPHAIEAGSALISMGVRATEVLSLSSAGPSDGYIRDTYLAQDLVVQHEYKRAAEAYQSLEAKYPENVHLLTSQALALTECSDFSAAFLVFAKVRALDNTAVTGMDTYARILKDLGQDDKLNELAKSLLATDINRPEAWVASAHFWDLKGDHVSALSLVEKALLVGFDHASAYVLQGDLHRSTRQYDQAVKSYHKANSANNIRASEGLVLTFLECNRFKEALTAAKNCLTLFPRCAKALSLVGRVLAQTQEGQKKAEKAFEKSLKADPLCSDTLFAFVDLLVADDKFAEATQLLEKFPGKGRRGTIQHKLADVLRLQATALNEAGDVSKSAALFSQSELMFWSALRTNPGLSEAKKGLELLEKSLQTLGAREEDNDAQSQDDDSFELMRN